MTPDHGSATYEQSHEPVFRRAPRCSPMRHMKKHLPLTNKFSVIGNIKEQFNDSQPPVTIRPVVTVQLRDTRHFGNKGVRCTRFLLSAIITILGLSDGLFFHLLIASGYVSKLLVSFYYCRDGQACYCFWEAMHATVSKQNLLALLL